MNSITTYAYDTRFVNRIYRFANAASREEFGQGNSIVHIPDEESAMMMALGYTLDEDFAVWQNGDDMMRGIGEGVDANDVAEMSQALDAFRPEMFWDID